MGRSVAPGPGRAACGVTVAAERELGLMGELLTAWRDALERRPEA